MALTREQLKEMELTDDQIERIIKGHAETVTGLTTERDRLNGELRTARDDAEQARNELQTYRQQVEADRLTAGKQAALRGALKEAGVQREDFVELLLKAVDLSAVELDGDRLKDAAALIAPLKASYGGCFAVTATHGTPPIDPPVGGQRLTREQVSGMSEAEINRSWQQVKEALGQR